MNASDRLKTVYDGDLRVAIIDYEVALAEHEATARAADSARKKSERLERLANGMRSNLLAHVWGDASEIPTAQAPNFRLVTT